jgi:hypothetical protein
MVYNQDNRLKLIQIACSVGINMPELKLLIDQLARVGQASFTDQHSLAVDARGASNVVKFWQTDQLAGSTRLAVSDPGSENKKENITSMVQALFIEKGVDTRFLLIF